MKKKMIRTVIAKFIDYGMITETFEKCRKKRLSLSSFAKLVKSGGTATAENYCSLLQ